jgi:hypothetical protein
MRHVERRGAPPRRRCALARLSAAALLSLALALPTAARSQDPYVVGGEDDPRDDGKTGPDPVVHAPATLLRTLHYSDRFAVALVALSPDGQELAAVTRASREGLKAWETATGHKLQLPPTPNSVGALAYSHDMGLLAVSVRSDPLARDGQGGLFLYDMQNGRLIETTAGGEDAASLAFSPDGSLLLVAVVDGVLAWRPGASRAALQRFLVMREGADWVSFSSQQEAYVGAQGGGLVLRVRVDDGEVLQSWQATGGEDAVAISPDGSLVARGAGKVLEIHRLQGGRGGTQRIDTTEEISALAWGASGEFIAAGTNSGDILLYRLAGVPGLPSQARGSPAPRGSSSAASKEAIVVEPPRGSGGSRGKARPRPPGPMLPGKRDQVIAEFRIRVLQQTDSDPRTAATMEKALRSRSRRLAGCWNKALRKKQRVAGSLVLELGVSPVGEGRSISAPLEDTIGNADLHLCIVDRLRDELFGPGLGGAEIELSVGLRVITSQ